MAPFPVTLSDIYRRFQGHGVIFRPMDVLRVLRAQLTRDLFAIAKFLLTLENVQPQQIHKRMTVVCG